MMTKSKNYKKRIALLSIFCMVISLMPASSFGLEPSDISGHWAKDNIQTWIEGGLINGYEDGTFRPDSNISRAEFMTLVNKAYNYSTEAEIGFLDVKASDWYYSAVAKAKAAGYITGYPDNTIRPEGSISRSEAAAIIMRINKLEGNKAAASKFTDAQTLDWGASAIGAVYKHSIMNGYPDGSFMAQSLIKRGEAVAALDKAKIYAKGNTTYDAAGTYGPATGTLAVEGNVIITKQDTTLQNMVINGDLTIRKSVGEGDVALNNVTVKGETLVCGGGPNSVWAYNSRFGTVTIIKEVGDIRFLISGTTTVEMVIAYSSVKLEEQDMVGANVGFIEVHFEGQPQETLILIGCFGDVDVNNPDTNVIMPRGTTVDSMCLNQRTDVTGEGVVALANIFVDGSTFEFSPETFDIIEGVLPPTSENPTAEVVVVPTPSGGGGHSSPSNETQAAPTGLLGVATSYGGIDGKITGTTTDMEYKLSIDSTYIAATDTEIINLAVGNYNVRYAAKEGFDVGSTKDVKVAFGVNSADQLASAITTSTAIDTIQLTNNITSIVAMTINKTINIDMNGFNISGYLAGYASANYYAFNVVGGDLTLDNTSATLSKLLVGTGASYELKCRGIRINRSGKATVKANVSIETGLPVMVYGNGTAGSAQLDVYGKLLVTVPYDSVSAYAAISGNGTAGYGGTIVNIYSGAEIISNYGATLFIPQDGVINIFGGTITSTATAIGIKSGTLNISGGTLRATGPANIPTEGYSNGINGSGCTIQIESNDAYSGNIVVNITGGTFISENGHALYEYLDSGNTDTEVDSISISGGVFQSAEAVGVTKDILVSEQLTSKGAITVTGGTFSKVIAEAAKISVTTLGAITVGDANSILQKAQALVSTGYTVSVKVADGTIINAEGVAISVGEGTIKFIVYQTSVPGIKAETGLLNITVQ